MFLFLLWRGYHRVNGEFHSALDLTCCLRWKVAKVQTIKWIKNENHKVIHEFTPFFFFFFVAPCRSGSRGFEVFWSSRWVGDINTPRSSHLSSVTANTNGQRGVHTPHHTSGRFLPHSPSTQTVWNAGGIRIAREERLGARGEDTESYGVAGSEPQEPSCFDRKLNAEPSVHGARLAMKHSVLLWCGTGVWVRTRTANRREEPWQGQIGQILNQNTGLQGPVVVDSGRNRIPVKPRAFLGALTSRDKDDFRAAISVNRVELWSPRLVPFLHI